MNSLSVGTMVGLGVSTLAANILNKSDKLNSFVNWISGAKINRDTLSQRVWHAAVDLLQDKFTDDKLLGERSSTLMPLATTVLIKGNKEEMKEAIRQLTSEGVDQILGSDLEGKKAQLSETIKSAAAGVANKLTEAYLGENAGEKVLATMVKRHGWEPLTEKLNNALGIFVGRDSFVSLIKGVLATAVVDKPGMDQSHSDEYRMLAKIAHVQITTGDRAEMIESVRTYAPKSFAAVETAKSVLNAGVNTTNTVLEKVSQAKEVAVNLAQYTSKTAPVIINNIQNATGIGLRPVVIHEAYAQTRHKIENGNQPIMLAANATDQDIADAYLKQLVIASTSTNITANASANTSANVPANTSANAPANTSANNSSISPENKTGVAVDLVTEAATEAQVNVMRGMANLIETKPERISEANKIFNAMALDQISALGERGGISVVKTLTGHIREIDTSSHRWLQSNETINKSIENNLKQAYPTETTQLGGYEVGSQFAQQIGQLKIDMPSDSYGYTDSAVEGGRALLNAGWGFLGWQTNSLSHANNTQLKQIYNVCGRDEGVMQEATRYLDNEAGARLIAATTVNNLIKPDTNPPLIDVNGTFVQLGNIEKPEMSFKITNNGDFVTLSIEAKWNITAFGKNENKLLTPRGVDNASNLTTNAIVNIRRSTADGTLAVSHYAMGVSASIENKILFDPSTGSLSEVQSTSQPKPQLESQFEPQLASQFSSETVDTNKPDASKTAAADGG